MGVACSQGVLGHWTNESLGELGFLGWFWGTGRSSGVM